MIAITRFYPGDEAALFAGNVLAQVTAAGLLAWLARRLLRKASAPTRHGIYLAALSWILLSPLITYVCQSVGLVTMAIPVAQAQVPAEPGPLLQVPNKEQPPGGQPVQTDIPAEKKHVQQPDLPEPEPDPGAKPEMAAPLLPTASKEEPAGKTPAEVPSAPSATEPLPQAQSWGEFCRAAVTLAFLVWGLAVLYFLARLMHGFMLLSALRRAVRPIHAERLDAVGKQVCQALGVDALPLLVAPVKPGVLVGSPIAVGIWRPMVVLPADLVDRLDARQLREVLIHECAHVFRRDHVVTLLQRLAEMLFWPHPLVHLLNRELAQAREEVCDNHVLHASSGPDYARTLLALAECSTNDPCIPATSGLLGPRWRLEDRVAGLLDQRRKGMIRMNRILAAGVTFVVMTTALAIAGTRLIDVIPRGVDENKKQTPAPVAGPPGLVPEKLKQKEEKPMPPAVPPSSEAVAKEGLSITIAPAKRAFVTQEPLAFVVTLKNVSQEPFMLFDADGAMNYDLEITRAANGELWVPHPSSEAVRVPIAASDSKVLQPGASLEIKLSLRKYVYVNGDPQKPTSRTRPFLYPDFYHVRVTRSFAMNPVKFNWPHKHWVGRLGTEAFAMNKTLKKVVEFMIIPADKPAVATDLAMTIAPAKAVFAAKEPLAFNVTLQNVSKEPFMLYQTGRAIDYVLQIKNAAGGAAMILTASKEALKRGEGSGSQLLEPGATLQIKLPLEGYQYTYQRAQDAAPAAHEHLEPGKYTIHVTRKFTPNLSPTLILYLNRFWVGAVAAKPVEFTVAAPKADGGGAVINKAAPDSANGLSITVKPAKAAFDMKEPVAFTVSFKNVSKQTMLVYNIDETMDYKIEFNGVPAGGPWVPQYLRNHQKVRAAPKAGDSRALAPGETLDKKIVLNGGVIYVYRGLQAASPIPLDHLEAGTYKVTVGFKGIMNPAPRIEWKYDHWIGAIAGQSTEFVMKPTGAAVVVKGLSVTALSDHLRFPGNNYPHFRVRFENVSGKDFSLFGQQASNWKIHIKNKDTGMTQTWQHVPVAAAPALRPIVLAAGKWHEEKIMLKPESFYVPPKNDRARYLDRGTYEVVFEIELREAPFAREIIPACWVGHVNTAPVEFKCGNQ